MSLIELLVVMVILVIGIFSITRIFPQGFRFLTHARNVTLAGRLAQAEVERWKAYEANVPDGIEAADATTGLVVTDYNPNDMSNAAIIPAGGDPWDWSNVNRVRLIRGETTRIPTATMLPYGAGKAYAFSMYNLKFAPVVFLKADDPGARPLPPGYEWPDQYVLIYGDPLPRTDISGLSGTDLEAEMENILNQRGLYGIDYTKAQVYFRPLRWTQKYKVDFAWWDGNVLRSQTQVLTVKDSDSADPVMYQLQGTAADGKTVSAANVEPYSDRVARKFDWVFPGDGTAPPSFDQRNPYQFTLMNQFNALSFAPTIGFNPIGEGRNVRTNVGVRPLTAHIDYQVVDWHIIREERTVPNPAVSDPRGYAIHLTLPSLKVAQRRYPDLTGVNNPVGKPNMAVYTGVTGGVPGYSLVALDMTDNTLLLDNSGPTGLQVDYTNGIVRVPAGVTKYTPFSGTLTGQDIRGHDLRFFYQASGDWAVQVSKAWSNYQAAKTGIDFNNLQYNTFDAEILKPGQASARQPVTAPNDQYMAVLTFPRSNSGLSVAVSFVWNDVNNVPHTVTGRQYQLPEFSNSAFPYLAIPFSAATGPNQFAEPAAGDEWKNPNFTFVQGASLKVRTVWREDPHRWEVRDLETFLTRK
jgi:hypothetical protein